MRLWRRVFNRNGKVTFVTMEMNEKKNQNGTELEPDKNSKKWMDCPALRSSQDYLCEIWCNYNERKYAQKGEN